MNEIVTKESLGIASVTTFPAVVEYRKELLSEKTDPAYIKMKDKFPYLPSKYVDDVFNKWFPIHNVDVLHRSDDETSVTYTVKITVAFPNGTIMSRVGAGGARKQIKSASRVEIESGKRGINPFDYVDNSNAEKAALTLAIKNCQERFGIGADVTERVILSPDEIKENNDTINAVLNSITFPKDKIKWKEKLASADTPNKKLALLNELREVYDVDEIISRTTET